MLCYVLRIHRKNKHHYIFRAADGFTFSASGAASPEFQSFRTVSFRCLLTPEEHIRSALGEKYNNKLSGRGVLFTATASS